jgi:uroporphyrin-III C-methyltransferase
VTFTADFDVTGRDVTVIGGSADALGNITSLLRGGASVTVVAPEAALTIRDLAARGLISWRQRSAEPADFEIAALVIAATGNDQWNDEVAAEAAQHNRVTLTVPAQPQPVAAPLPAEQRGTVILVGGGPGDPGLLTVAGLAAIRSADVIICDRLAPLPALQQARAGAEIIDVGKIPRGSYTSQERINEQLIRYGRQGKRVVRLKGGDNFVFGRGGEEWQACVAAGIPVQVIPGVTSAVAGPALAGIPLTHRQLTQGFTVVSGHLPPGDPGSTLNWGALARANTTLVIMMGVSTLPAIAAELIGQGLAASTAAITVSDAGLPSQRAVRGTVSTIAALCSEALMKPPAITVIGAVAGFDPAG